MKLILDIKSKEITFKRMTDIAKKTSEFLSDQIDVDAEIKWKMEK